MSAQCHLRCYYLTVPVKRCTRCKEALPVDSFYASTRSKDGLQAACKRCQEHYRRKRVASKRLALLAALPPDHHERKRCPKCDQVKSRSEYHKNRSTADGLQGYCKPCSAEVQRAYLARNAEVVAAKQAAKIIRGSQRVQGVKTCTKCGQSKPVLSFYLHRGTRDGRAAYCAECQKTSTRAWKAANREKASEQLAAWAAANPGKKKRNHRQYWLKMYGLDQESYTAMLEAQRGVCAICELPERYIDSRTGEPRRLSVDHCHTSGKVRGLLCGRCNRSIGQFADDHERLSRAAAYLREAAV